jgi:hypothetical protein
MYRIIQWATGAVGMASLQSVLATPDYELVGAFVYNPDKSGRDVGELAGMGKLGVMTTSDPEEIYAMEADCVVFNALGDTRGPAGVAESEEAICRLLASGKNVVSTAVTAHIHPRAMKPETRARLEAACRQGGTSYHSNGINPGFTFDMLPIALTNMSDRIDHIHCVELVDMSRSHSREIVHEGVGMGYPPEKEVLSSLAQSSKAHPYYVGAYMLEDAFGIEFDDVKVTLDKAVTDVPITCPWGVVEVGTTAALRMRMQAYIAGQARATWDLIWRVSNDVAPDWPTGDSSWEVNITGDPSMRCRFDMESDQHRAVSLLTSMTAVNAIRAVIQAEPGVKTRLDLPVFAGGRFSSKPR